jgi:hypothetical protein
MEYGRPCPVFHAGSRQLDEELLALGEETMLLEELDGFIVGLLVCPDLIKPGEWLPIAWNRDSADQQPASGNLDPVPPSLLSTLRICAVVACATVSSKARRAATR